VREERAERGFAGAAQTDQSDAGTARRGIDAAKFFEKKLVGIGSWPGGSFFKNAWIARTEEQAGWPSAARVSIGTVSAGQPDAAGQRNVAATEFDLCQKTREKLGFLRELPRDIPRRARTARSFSRVVAE